MSRSSDNGNNCCAVRITVLRRTQNEDFLEQYATSKWDKCDLFEEGQVFTSRNMEMPDHFCSHAWQVIYPFVFIQARGGRMQGTKNGDFISCCNDGFRPVFFRIERVG